MNLTGKQGQVLDALRLAELSNKRGVSSKAVAYSGDHEYDLMTASEAKRVLRALLKKGAVVEMGDRYSRQPSSLWLTTHVGREALSQQGGSR